MSLQDNALGGQCTCRPMHLEAHALAGKERLAARDYRQGNACREAHSGRIWQRYPCEQGTWGSESSNVR
eukprot:scaffold101347_cov17-Tisochrysis_lutea.AAC.1